MAVNTNDKVLDPNRPITEGGFGLGGAHGTGVGNVNPAELKDGLGATNEELQGDGDGDGDIEYAAIDKPGFTPFISSGGPFDKGGFDSELGPFNAGDAFKSALGDFQYNPFEMGEFEFDESSVRTSEQSPIDLKSAFNQIKQQEAVTGTPLSAQQVGGIAEPMLQAKTEEAVRTAEINARREIEERKQQFTEFATTKGMEQQEHQFETGLSYSEFQAKQGREYADFQFGRDAKYEEYKWGRQLERDDWELGEKYRHDDYLYEQAIAQGNHEQAEQYKMDMFKTDVQIRENQLDRDLQKWIAENTGSGGKIVCTELNRQGMLSDEVLKYDYAYREAHIDDVAYHGYLVLMSSFVEKMQKSKLFTYLVSPFIRAFAYESASRMNNKIKGNLLGKFMIKAGIPICKFTSRWVMSQQTVSRCKGRL